MAEAPVWRRGTVRPTRASSRRTVTAPLSTLIDLHHSVDPAVLIEDLETVRLGIEVVEPLSDAIEVRARAV